MIHALVLLSLRIGMPVSARRAAGTSRPEDALLLLKAAPLRCWRVRCAWIRRLEWSWLYYDYIVDFLERKPAAATAPSFLSFSYVTLLDGALRRRPPPAPAGRRPAAHRKCPLMAPLACAFKSPTIWDQQHVHKTRMSGFIEQKIRFCQFCYQEFKDI